MCVYYHSKIADLKIFFIALGLDLIWGALSIVSKNELQKVNECRVLAH